MLSQNLDSRLRGSDVALFYSLRGSDGYFVAGLRGNGEGLGPRLRGNDDIVFENDNEILDCTIWGGALPTAPCISAATLG